MARMFPTSDPSLPPYKSLIVQGDYHPSAPIHMCLSAPTGAKALLLSSARQALIRSLSEYNDEWLFTNSGTGNSCQSSSKVDIFYPPTPNHLVVLLSAFRTYKASDPVPLDAKATLESVPSLLVLHELSAYFLPINENKPYVLFALAVCSTFLGKFGRCQVTLSHRISNLLATRWLWQVSSPQNHKLLCVSFYSIHSLTN
jgi:hypothetical protein